MSLKSHYENMSSEEAYRRVAEGYLYSTTFLSPPPVYDPIFTPLFVSLGVTGSFTIGAATISYASVLSAVATTALTVGLQALMAPKAPDPESGRVPKTQSVPYRIYAVGRNRLAGAYMMWEASGDYLYAVQALAAHKIKSINRYWLHDDEVFLDVDGYTTNDDNGRYGNNVRLLTRLGASTETPYAPLVSKLSASGVWTNNHRGDGQSSVAMIAESTAAKNQQKRFPYGAPQVSVELDGALCWDFRDGAQSPTNPATWTWTRNSALILCWHECFNEFGNRRDYTKAILPVIDMWIEEADICDENVTLAAGGTEKRYECGGWDTTENGPKVGTNAILASCDGWMCERGDGALLLTVGKFRESRVGTLSDADLIGHQIQYDVLFEDECNRLVPKFTYPDTGYSSCDTDYFEDTAAQLTAGRVLAQEGDYKWCQQWRQARRLGKRDWLRLLQKVKGSIDVRLSGLNAIYSRWVRISSPLRLPLLDGKVIENRKSTLAITQGGFTMDIIQHPDNIDDWTPGTDEGAQPPVPNQLGTGEIAQAVINIVQAKANGGSVYLRVVLVDPETDSWTPVIFYRLTNVGGGTPGAWVEQQFPDWTASGGFVELNTGAVPVDVDIDVQAGYIGSNGSYGPRSPTVAVHTTADPTAPGVPVAFTAPVVSLVVSPSARAANDNTRFLVFKRGTTSQTFAAATQLGSDYGAYPNQVVSITDSPSYGHWKYWASSKNASGVPSATQASLLVDVYGPELTTNGTFDADASWTKGTGWTIASGVATHASGTAASLTQAVSLTAGAIYELTYTITSLSGGSITPQLTGGTTVSGTARTSAGTYTQTLTAATGNTTLGFAAAAAAVGSIDAVSLKRIG